jgi:hypothetical protein
VFHLRGTGILGPYTTTYFSDSSKMPPESKSCYEKNTEKNIPFQKSHLKLALNSNSLHDNHNVSNYSRTRHHSKRTKIYENLSRTLCMHSPSK